MSKAAQKKILQAGRAKLQAAYPNKSIGAALQAEKKQNKIAAHNLGIKLAAWDAGLQPEFTDQELALLEG